VVVLTSTCSADIRTPDQVKSDDASDESQNNENISTISDLINKQREKLGESDPQKIQQQKHEVGVTVKSVSEGLARKMRMFEER